MSYKNLIQLSRNKTWLFVALFFSCATVRNSRPVSPILVIENVNVVDVVEGKILPAQDVAVKDKIIYFIGDSFAEPVSSNTIYIDGSGKFLSPALWDMHFHLCWDPNNDTLLFPILIKNGISAIRDMGGSLQIMRRFKEQVKKGEIIGPDIYGAGPMIDGNPPVYVDFSMPADDQTNMTAALDSLRKNGADFFKTYSLINETQLREISAYCFKNKVSFAGHLSEYIEPEISINLGQKSIEHLNRLDDIWRSNKIRLDSIGNLMIANNTFLCPTLIIYQLKTRIRDSSMINRDYARYISPSLMAEWKALWKKRSERHTKLANWKELDTTFLSQMALVNRLGKMGVMILAGTDFAGMPFVYPGISLHQELGLLVESGLSNYEALKTATINPAIFMSQQRHYGSISLGKYADMLLLEKNPLEDIAHTKTIDLVILKGEIQFNNN